MKYVGIDLHKDTAFIVVLEGREGHLVKEGELPTDLNTILRFLKPLGKDVQIAIESTSSWHWLVDALEGRKLDVRLAHPKKVRLIAESSKKTDRNDAYELADLLRMGRLPEAHIASKEARARREILRHRTRLVRLRTQAKSRIRAEVRKLNLKPTANLFTKAGYAWLRNQEFPVVTRAIIDDQVTLLDTMGSLIRTVETSIDEEAAQDPRLPLLISIPGVGLYTALTVLAEIDTIDRFVSAERLTAYFGLVPRVRSTAGVARHGQISKEGSRWARALLIQAAWIAVRKPGRFHNRYRRVMRKKGKKIAVTAVARDIVNVMYYLLKRGEEYSAERGRTDARRRSA